MKNKENAIGATLQFANKFTTVSENSITEQLFQHPHYPSLLSISDVLQFEGVQNFAAKAKIEDLSQITFPVMAHLHIKGGVFVVLQKLINNQISYWLDGNIINEPIENFNTKWSETVLIPENSISNVGKIDNLFNTWKHTGFVTLCSFLISLLIWNALGNTVFNSTLLFGQFFSLILGFFVAILIILQSIDHRNPLVQKLCGGGTKTDCNHILGSNAAKINAWLGWADVGLFYYTGCFLLLLNSNNTTSTTILCTF